MLAIILALGSSVAWGLADYLGGFKSRSFPVPVVLAVMYLASLAAMALDLATYDPTRVHGYRLSRAALGRQVARLGAAVQAERERMVGLDPLRADVIFAAESARFGHPEQTIAIVTLLGGIYRVAERAGRSRAAEWALTSEQVPAPVMAAAGVVNRVVPDEALLDEATAFARKVAQGPTRAYAAHKALLRTWAVGGVAAADEAMFDIAMPLFETEDAKAGLTSAVNALRADKPRPVLEFQGR